SFFAYSAPASDSILPLYGVYSTHPALTKLFIISVTVGGEIFNRSAISLFGTWIFHAPSSNSTFRLSSLVWLIITLLSASFISFILCIFYPSCFNYTVHHFSHSRGGNI